MIKVSIKLEPTEPEQVLAAIQKVQNRKGKLNFSTDPTPTPVSAIAKELRKNINRTRYIIDELVAAGRLKKIPIKEGQSRYHSRFYFEVVK